MKAENKSYPLIFDPSCGKGEFLIESANKLAANNCSSVLTRLWAADFSQLNLLLTKKRLENWAKNNNQMVVDFSNMICYKRVEDLAEKVKDMKFDIIVGNPPYQQKTNGHGAHAKPIYQHFIQLAKSLNPETISMVIPSRWMASGMGLGKFRQEMMNDKFLKMIVDYQNADDLFPTTKIEGGVQYFIWDKNHGNTENPKCLMKNVVDGKVIDESLRDLNEYDIIIRFGKDVPILKKIQKYNEPNFDTNVSAQRPFGFETNFSKYSEENFPDSVKLYKRNGTGYVNKSLVLKNNNWISKYKVLLSEAYGGSEKFYHVIIGKPLVAEPNSVCTGTYLVCGVFDTQKEAENLAAYMKTRIFRFLVSLRKNTQHNSADKFKFVPDLPMTEKWTDDKLCKRWKITNEEFAYISSRVKEMF